MNIKLCVWYKHSYTEMNPKILKIDMMIPVGFLNQFYFVVSGTSAMQSVIPVLSYFLFTLFV